MARVVCSQLLRQLLYCFLFPLLIQCLFLLFQPLPLSFLLLLPLLLSILLILHLLLTHLLLLLLLPVLLSLLLLLPVLLSFYSSCRCFSPSNSSCLCFSPSYSFVSATLLLPPAVDINLISAKLTCRRGSVDLNFRALGQSSKRLSPAFPIRSSLGGGCGGSSGGGGWRWGHTAEECHCTLLTKCINRCLHRNSSVIC